MGFASVIIRGGEPDHWQSQCHTCLVAELRIICRTVLGFAIALRPELLGHWQIQWQTEIGF
jgi:hypothetical protein